MEAVFGHAEKQSTLVRPLYADLPNDLRAFLTTPQEGVRAIARSLVDRVIEVRQGQLSAHVEKMVHMERLGRVFANLPEDRGHFGTPYMPLMLRGLVHSPQTTSYP